MKKAYDVAAGTLTFTAADGTVQTLTVADLPESIRLQAMFHGLSQKIGDSYAGAASEADPEAYAKQCVREQIEQLLTGAWRASGGGGGPKHSHLVLAFAQVAGTTPDEAAEYIGKLDEKEQKELRKQPKIKVAIERLKIEAATRRLQAAEKAAQEETAA